MERPNPVYLGLRYKSASTEWSHVYSTDGEKWINCSVGDSGAITKSLTKSYVGIGLIGWGNNKQHMATFDWFRVISVII
jgi:hypothetical protein